MFKIRCAICGKIITLGVGFHSHMRKHVRNGEVTVEKHETYAYNRKGELITKCYPNYIPVVKG